MLLRTQPSSYLAASLHHKVPCVWSLPPQKDHLWPVTVVVSTYRQRGSIGSSQSDVGGGPTVPLRTALPQRLWWLWTGQLGTQLSPTGVYGAPAISAKCWSPSGLHSLPGRRHRHQGQPYSTLPHPGACLRQQGQWPWRGQDTVDAE